MKEKNGRLGMNFKNRENMFDDRDKQVKTGRSPGVARRVGRSVSI